MIHNYSIIFYIFIFSLFPKQEIECLNCSDQNTFSVLVITETKGYVHRSAIKAGIANTIAIRYSIIPFCAFLIVPNSAVVPTTNKE